jgi:hypothetical protein
MAVSRRGAIKALGTAAAVPILRLKAAARGLQAEELDAATLAAIADVVLPSEIGVNGRKEAVGAFTRWVRNYKEGADTDHGYGNTRIRSTVPSPARNYPAQMAALDAAARAKGAPNFAAASADDRRALIDAAIATAKVERLPSRPTGAHVATDLMGHYFNSSAGSDLCYRAAIGRDTCRGLPGSDNKPAALGR